MQAACKLLANTSNNAHSTAQLTEERKQGALQRQWPKRSPGAEKHLLKSYIQTISTPLHTKTAERKQGALQLQWPRRSLAAENHQSCNYVHTLPTPLHAIPQSERRAHCNSSGPNDPRSREGDLDCSANVRTLPCRCTLDRSAKAGCTAEAVAQTTPRCRQAWIANCLSALFMPFPTRPQAESGEHYSSSGPDDPRLRTSSHCKTMYTYGPSRCTLCRRAKAGRTAAAVVQTIPRCGISFFCFLECYGGRCSCHRPLDCRAKARRTANCREPRDPWVQVAWQLCSALYTTRLTWHKSGRTQRIPRCNWQWHGWPRSAGRLSLRQNYVQIACGIPRKTAERKQGELKTVSQTIPECR